MGCGFVQTGIVQHAQRGNPSGLTWKHMRPIPFQVYGQGEYIGCERSAHVSEYRLRVDDQISFLFRNIREETADSYQISVGDEFEVRSKSDPTLDTTVQVMRRRHHHSVDAQR